VPILNSAAFLRNKVCVENSLNPQLFVDHFCRGLL
jgi:hypothetical protein